jgi:hypothetical protein
VRSCADKTTVTRALEGWASSEAKVALDSELEALHVPQVRSREEVSVLGQPLQCAGRHSPCYASCMPAKLRLQVAEPNKALAASSPWSESGGQGSFLGSVWALTKRGFLNSWRNPAVIWLRFAMYLMLAILIGELP